MKEISIIVPVFNSEENLNELHRQINDAMQEIDFELIFINDGSTDNSMDIIRFIAINHANVVAINLRKNFGQDNAIMAGLNYASSNYIVIMDDDLQHSPYDIPLLYNKCKEGFDICYAKFSDKNQALWKNFGSWTNGIFAQLLFKKPKNIYMSPFKIIKAGVIKDILQYKGPFPYIEGLLLQVTQNIASISTQHHVRYKGRSNFNFIRSFSVFLKTLTSFSVLPLRLATLIGFSTSLIGFVMAIYYLMEYFLINHTVEGWTSLMISSLIIGGMMLMFLGLIGEYIGRIFLTLNNKPQYSIDEVISMKSKHIEN